VGSLQPDNRYDGSSRDPEVAGKLVKAKQQGTSATKRGEDEVKEAMLSGMAIKDLIIAVGSDCRLLQRQ
jgi:hypothetical protein